MTAFTWIDGLVEQLGFWRSEKQPWQPPTDDAVARLEAELGGPLPAEYRYFIAKYGGGLLGTDDHKVSAPIVEPCPWGEDTNPEKFYPLHADHRDDIEKQRRTFRERLPSGVLPVSRDAGANQLCLDVAGKFPGSVWFWDHEQRWFTQNLEEAAQEIDALGGDASRADVHQIIRAWARLHAGQFDRPADYMGMYRMADSFADFLRSLKPVPY